MSFIGIKNAGTILGSHEWQFDKLENFAITFWKKPTFTVEHGDMYFTQETAVFQKEVLVQP